MTTLGTGTTTLDTITLPTGPVVLTAKVVAGLGSTPLGAALLQCEIVGSGAGGEFSQEDLNNNPAPADGTLTLQTAQTVPAQTAYSLQCDFIPEVGTPTVKVGFANLIAVRVGALVATLS